MGMLCLPFQGDKLLLAVQPLVTKVQLIAIHIRLVLLDIRDAFLEQLEELCFLSAWPYMHRPSQTVENISSYSLPLSWFGCDDCRELNWRHYVEGLEILF